MTETLEGGCHCGAVRYRVQVRSFEALECNCSVCSKKGLLHLIVDREDFELLKGDEDLSHYRFLSGVADHMFCRICGVQSFYIPRSHPDQIDVNIRCLDGDVVERFTVTAFDGRNWEEHIGEIRDP